MGTHDNPMDHEERLKQNLEVLGVDNLSSLTLDELAEGIDNKFPSTLNLSTKRLIHIYVAWLNERLTVIDNSDDETFQKELQGWVQFLRQFPVLDRFLSTCFQSWVSEHSKVDPTSSRRLGFAWIALQEILDLEGEEDYGSPDHNTPSRLPESNIGYPQDSNSHQLGSANTQNIEHMEREGGSAVDDRYRSMHPERWRQSLGDDAVEDGHGGTMQPVIYRQALGDEENEVEDEQPNENPLSFLTGANYLAYLEMMKNTRRENSGSRDGLAGLHGSRPSVGQKVEAESFSQEEINRVEVVGVPGSGANQGNKASNFRPPKRSGRSMKSRKISGKYHCMRCNSHGHVVEDCPTNLDPGYDLSPVDESYVCVYCGRGGHYATVCQKNPLENSLHQRRLRAGIYQATGPDLDNDPRPRDPERHKRGDYGREYDQDFDQDHKRARDRDYGRDYDRDNGRDHDRDQDRDHVRHYDHYDLGHSRGYDQDRGREPMQRHHEGYDRRDERRSRQRSRSQERPGTGRDHNDNNGRRSLSPAAANRDKKKARDRRRIDRYRSDKRNPRNTSRRSRSPRENRHKTSRPSRSPLRDLSSSEKPPWAERKAVSKVRDRECVKDIYQDNSLEGPTHGDPLQDRCRSQEPVSAFDRRILGHSKLSGILSYADGLEDGDKDVIMAELNDRMPFDGDPAWEVFNLPLDEFLVALDELINEIANTIPSDDMDVEEVEPMDTSQPIECAQPAMKLTAASLGLLMPTTIQEEKLGDISGLARFKELSLTESEKSDREESPIVFGVSVKSSGPESSYGTEVKDWMKTCSRMNVWVNKTQRNRANDFITFAPKIDDSAEVLDSNAVEFSEPDEYKSGYRGVKRDPDDSMKAETPGSCEQEDITMVNDEITKEAEVGVAPLTEGLAKHEDVLSRQELEVETMGVAEDRVMSENVITQEQEAAIPTMPKDHVMTEGIIALEPEHEVPISAPAKNHGAPVPTSPDGLDVGDDSLISVATGDSSTTEIGDQVIEDVDMLVPDVTQGAAQY